MLIADLAERRGAFELAAEIRGDVPDGLKDKTMYRVDGAATRVTPRALFLPRFTARRSVRPVAPELAVERIIAMNRLTIELDDYGWFAAALDLHWPEAGNAERKIDTVRRFARATPCFDLGIDRAAGVDAVVDDILATVTLAARAPPEEEHPWLIPSRTTSRPALPTRCRSGSSSPRS